MQSQEGSQALTGQLETGSRNSNRNSGAWEVVLGRSLGWLESDGFVGSALDEEGFGSLPVAIRHTDARP